MIRKPAVQRLNFMQRSKTHPTDPALDIGQRTVRRSLGSLLASLAMVLVLCFAPPVHAQNVPYALPRVQVPDSGPSLAGDTGSPDLDARRLKALNAERQKSLVSDTNKLVKLTAELNAQINSTHSASLTEDQIHMVAEIEKLAHSIREKMCTSVKGVPLWGTPGPSLIPPLLP